MLDEFEVFRLAVSLGVFALLVVPLAALGGLLFSALGLITTAVSPKIDTFNLPIFVIVFPMFLLSGTFFPVDILPGWAYALALALPLTHVSFLVRGACLGVTPPLSIANLAYLVAVTVVLLIQVVGLILVLALLTLPAAVAGHYVHSLGRMMLIATLLGGVLSIAGLAL